MQALFAVALATGMRKGELLGLRWQDVDLDKCTLHVVKTLHRNGGGKYELGEPNRKLSSGRCRCLLWPLTRCKRTGRGRVKRSWRRCQVSGSTL